MAQTIEKNTGLGHMWQKMVCLFTDRRGIDESLHFDFYNLVDYLRFASDGFRSTRTDAPPIL